MDAQGLKDLSCKTGAIYTQTNNDDDDESGLQRAMISFYKYYALVKTLEGRRLLVAVAAYESIPSIWGPMTTVVAPVYDKSREPWHMMGVAGVDATVCDLLQNKVPIQPVHRTGGVPKTYVQWRHVFRLHNHELAGALVYNLGQLRLVQYGKRRGGAGMTVSRRARMACCRKTPDPCVGSASPTRSTNALEALN